MSDHVQTSHSFTQFTFFCFFFSTSCFYFSTFLIIFHVTSNISNSLLNWLPMTLCKVRSTGSVSTKNECPDLCGDGSSSPCAFIFIFLEFILQHSNQWLEQFDWHLRRSFNHVRMPWRDLTPIHPERLNHFLFLLECIFLSNFPIIKRKHEIIRLWIVKFLLYSKLH